MKTSIRVAELTTGDPDEGLELREEIKIRLQQSLEAERRGVRGIPVQEVAAQLGLDMQAATHALLAVP